jgi:serine/threonine protein kinase
VTGRAATLLKLGTLLKKGAFSVGRVLGRGGFGVTYLGADLRRQTPVALKEFFPAGSTRNGQSVVAPDTLSRADYLAAIQQFLDEGQILARFHHPNIVDVYDVFRENATAYLAMEYLRGETLLGRLEANGGPLSEAELLAIARPLVDALDVIHAAGLLHRDIKPDNVILAEGRGNGPAAARPVLIDFGATREFVSGRTMRQSVLVTPGYAPLEQYAQQARRGPFTDIYALAATLYHLATGQQPPPATDRAAGIDLKPPRQLNPLLSQTFDQAIMHAMEIAIDRRPPTAREFYQELSGASALLPTTGTTASTSVPATAPTNGATP